MPSKTRHNEVAPAQFELAPMFEATTVGSDHNMLLLNLMRKIAFQHGLAALVHEKPFRGVNGSGKHNNWSMATDDGENLLNPGHDPHANAQFLTFLAAVIRAVNVHADLLRASVADAGNDHRLGANEAPPAIVSIFLGAQLEDIVEQLEKGTASSSKQGGKLELGVTTLPVLPKDSTDRNRTSPFAFTGNRFEFRAVGSSVPIYWPQTVLNTIVAESLSLIADKLEKLKSNDFAGLTKILSEVIKENKKVLFSGNNYAEEWHAEAAKRGLPNNKSTVDALPAMQTEKAKKIFAQFGVLSERELESRYEIAWERYVKVQNIEANATVEIARTLLVPAAVKYLGELGAASKSKGASKLADKIAGLVDSLVENIDALEKAQHAAHAAGSLHAEAKAFKEKVIPAQDLVREAADALETLVSDELWPLPKYRELLFQY
jgi:glutamine synthetase